MRQGRERKMRYTMIRCQRFAQNTTKVKDEEVE
jgi:hypothetical protein